MQEKYPDVDVAKMMELNFPARILVDYSTGSDNCKAEFTWVMI